MKTFFRNIHLYLSLAAGLVIMTCCFTGAVLVFEQELQELFHHDRYYVKQQASRLPVESLVASVKLQYPQAKVASVKLYGDQSRSAEIGISLDDKKPGGGEKGKAEAGKPSGDKPREKISDNQQKPAEAVAKGVDAAGGKRPAVGGGGRASHTVFVDPYNGKVLELYSYRETFFYTMFSLHRWLLGGSDSIGKTITGVATFIFLFILITGVILWWPRNRTILLQRLRIKTDANFKRLNHDLHIVLGFYSAIFLFIFAFTALAWSFTWFNNGIYTITKTSPKPAEPPTSNLLANKSKISYDAALSAIASATNDPQYITLRAPNDSTGVFTATVLPRNAHESAADNYYIDQYSAALIGSLKFEDKNAGQRIRATFKPVHVGSIYGLPSKIIACIVCLLGVTFPVTGVIMWINRLKKNKRRKVNAQKSDVVVV